MNPNLFLVRHLPGAGATTLARYLAGANYAADDFFENPCGGYHFDPKQLSRAHDACKSRALHTMQCRGDLAVHNTFTEGWELAPYVRMAEDHGYVVVVVDLFDAGMTDGELAERNIHSVPQEVIASMRERWEHDWRSADPRPPWER